MGTSESAGLENFIWIEGRGIKCCGALTWGKPYMTACVDKLHLKSDTYWCSHFRTYYLSRAYHLYNFEWSLECEVLSIFLVFLGMSEQGGWARGGRARGRARQQQEQAARRPGEESVPPTKPCPPPGFHQHSRPRPAAPSIQLPPQQQVKDCWVLHAVEWVTLK